MEVDCINTKTLYIGKCREAGNFIENGPESSLMVATYVFRFYNWNKNGHAKAKDFNANPLHTTIDEAVNDLPELPEGLHREEIPHQDGNWIDSLSRQGIDPLPPKEYDRALRLLRQKKAARQQLSASLTKSASRKVPLLKERYNNAGELYRVHEVSKK